MEPTIPQGLALLEKLIWPAVMNIGVEVGELEEEQHRHGVFYWGR